MPLSGLRVVKRTDSMDGAAVPGGPIIGMLQTSKQVRGCLPRLGRSARMPSDSESPQSDLRLIQRVRAGSPEATQEFLQRLACIPAILRLRNRRLGNALDEATLQDLAQDVLLVLWSKLDSYTGAGPLNAWVYRFCTHKHYALVRDRGLASSIERQTTDAPDPHDPRSETSESSEVDAETLHAALADLDPKVASILRWRHFDELSFVQIGVRLKVPEATAKTRYYRALQRLRESLERRVGE